MVKSISIFNYREWEIYCNFEAKHSVLQLDKILNEWFDTRNLMKKVLTHRLKITDLA